MAAPSPRWGSVRKLLLLSLRGPPAAGDSSPRPAGAPPRALCANCSFFPCAARQRREALPPALWARPVGALHTRCSFFPCAARQRQEALPPALWARPGGALNTCCSFFPCAACSAAPALRKVPAASAWKGHSLLTFESRTYPPPPGMRRPRRSGAQPPHNPAGRLLCCLVPPARPRPSLRPPLYAARR